MRKIPASVFILVAVLIILLSIDYLASNNSRADVELVGVSNGLVGEKQPTPVAEEPSTGTDAQVSNGEPVSPPGQQNEVDPDQPTQSKFLIDVSVTDQKVRVFENDKMIKEWVVSTGQNDSTPLGRFKIQNRGVWFFSEKYQQGAMWWVSFKDWGIYLFHSLPMDREKNILTEEANKLGSPVSHGCVRLEVDHAKWIYDNIPKGTDVYIHK